MKIILKLSESLLSIYRETDNPLKEIIELYIDEPTTLYSIIQSIGVNPILVPMITINDRLISSLDYLIENDETITLIGPLAGG